ncbi:MAG TPA: hypothetical protein VH419_06320 [Nocardioidaceae bacterium]|jgi:hypothetical protein
MNDIRFAAKVENAADSLDPAQIRTMAVTLIAEAGDNVLAQTRRALEEAYADNDPDLYALWEAIQVEVLNGGPSAEVYA